MPNKPSKKRWWESLPQVIAAIAAVLGSVVAILTHTNEIAAFFSRPMDDSVSFVAVLSKLPPSQHEDFRKQALYKANTPTPATFRVLQLVTIFFELKSDTVRALARTSPETLPDTLNPGFVKFQLVTLDRESRGSMRIAARTSPSKPGHVATAAVFRWTSDGKVTGDGVTSNSAEDVVDVELLPGDQLLIVGVYDDYLLSDVLHGSRRDWHMIEISDLAAHGSVHSLFATGSANYRVDIAASATYEFYPSKGVPVFASTLKHSFDSGRLRVALEPTLRDLIRSDVKVQEKVLEAARYLIDGGFKDVLWAGDEATGLRDRAYVTQLAANHK